MGPTTIVLFCEKRNVLCVFAWLASQILRRLCELFRRESVIYVWNASHRDERVFYALLLSGRWVDALFVEPRKSAVILAKPPPTYRYNHANKFRICINGYELDMSKAIDKVYKFELKIYGIKSDGKEKELHRGPKNDVAIALRHRILWSIYQQMLKSYEDFFGNDSKKYFYDCGINFYSINKLFDRSEGEKELKINIELLSPETRDFLTKRISGLVARLLPCEEISLHHTTAISAGLYVRERSLQQFLEIATSQMMFHEQNHLIFHNKAYDIPNEHDTGVSGGKVLIAGMEKNVRFVGNSWKQAVPVVQIDAKKAAFFKKQSLVELVGTLCNRAHPRMLVEDARLRARIARQLKDLVVRTVHLETQRLFCIFGMTTATAEELVIPVNNQDTTVADYMLYKYQRRLRYPGLPCIIERRVGGGDKHPRNSFHPMEFLEVVEGQRVDIKKQTPELVDELIQNCRLLPMNLKNENECRRRRAQIVDENPYLHNLGIHIINTPRTGDATVQFPPAIVYKNSKVEPNPNGDLDWRLSVPRGMPNKIFFRPAVAPRRWVVFMFHDAVDQMSADLFIAAFVNRSRDHGIQMPNPSRSEEYNRTDMDFLTEKIEFMRRNGVEYILFITRDKYDPVHDTMKLTEIKCGVVTQHIHSNTVFKAISNRGAEMTLDNLVMKMNLKLGGITHALSSSAAFLSKNRLTNNVMDQEWLRHTRMFFGLNMSHASPQSLYERQANILPSEPTVVAMTFSCGEPFAMQGEYWMQEPRLHIAKFLKERVEKAVRMFKDTSRAKRLPEHVIVFRGGVSEGEYAKIISEEGKEFREAFVAAADGHMERVRLTIVVMQAHSNYRIYPEHIQQGSASQQNVPPGTIVDGDVVHPTQTEFIFVAHKSIMGTARPIRATVLVDDEPRMSMDELEGITNALCYAHGIVTSPISLPAHLYAAADLAKRGRNNFKTEQNIADDNGSASSSSDGRGRFTNDGSENYFPMISAELANKLKYKFWA
uniref:Piwi domain-containing protein n=1 Tax=Onchocerca volvulus TaxID=6282 RepID=A0A8R1XN14_ONCVO